MTQESLPPRLINYSHCFTFQKIMEIVLVSIILGATILLFFYISKIFNTKGSPEIISQEVPGDVDIDNSSGKNETAGNNKTKKKVADKKPKDKGFTFHHPWLVSTLKGHSGRVLGMRMLIHNLSVTNHRLWIFRHGSQCQWEIFGNFLRGQDSSSLAFQGFYGQGAQMSKM